MSTKRISWIVTPKITTAISGVTRYGHDGKNMIADFCDGVRVKKSMSREEFASLGAFSVADLRAEGGAK